MLKFYKKDSDVAFGGGGMYTDGEHVYMMKSGVLHLMLDWEVRYGG